MFRISHYKKIIQKLLQERGLLFTTVILVNLTINKCFTKFVFGHWDMNVKRDLRIVGAKYMKFGKHFSMNRGGWLQCVESYENNTKFHPQLIIGDNVSIGEYVHIGCNHYIKIGNNVLMGSKIYITDHNHGVYRGENCSTPDEPPIKRKLTESGKVIIEDNVWIGEFCTILPDVTIGRGSIIGSHTTVTHNIPPASIAVGSPARVIKKYNRETKQWEKVSRI